MLENVNKSEVWMDSLINKIAKNMDEDLKDICYKASIPADSFFLSDVFFLTITANFNGKTENKRSIEVVVKKPPMSENVRLMARSDEQFHNEIVFYRMYGNKQTDFPYCFYAEEKPPTDSVIVLENVVSQKGYDVIEFKYDIPLEYAVAAFREIGRFHGKAYVTKEQQKNEFFDLIQNLQEPRYVPTSNLATIINLTATRSIEYLRKQGYDEQFCDKVQTEFENAYENIILKTLEPEEPFATLCHGDWTINNTLFKRENGELKVMFIDFALIRYGSPVIDLSTFLCLHCAKDLDKDMLDTVLKVYHDSLEKCLMENGIYCEKYSFEALCEDYKKRGLFGFFIATFFLAVQMGKNTEETGDLANKDDTECALFLRELGGDEVSEILANMLLKLKDFGCLDYIL